MLGYLGVAKELDMKFNIVIHCYWTVNTAFKDKKSKAEIISIIEDMAIKSNMSFLDFTSKALEINKNTIEVAPEKIEYYKAFLREIRKPFLRARREELQAAKNIILRNDTTKEAFREDRQRKCLAEKQKLSIYFNALLSVYGLEMAYDLGLNLVGQRLDMNPDKIEALGYLYIQKYALSEEKERYEKKVRVYNNLVASPTKKFIYNTLAFRILQILASEDYVKASKEISLLLQGMEQLNYDYLKLILKKEIEINLVSAKTETQRKIIFKKQDYLDKVLEKSMVKVDINKPQKEPQKPNISVKKLDALLMFLKSNIALKEFATSPAWPFKSKSYAMAKKYLEEACGSDETLKGKLAQHLQELEEYELSYLDTILEIILYFRKNGIAISEGCQREFDVIDYYTLTNYPLNDLRSAVMDKHLIADSDLKYLSSLVGNITSMDNFYNTVSLKNFLNDITGYTSGDKIYYLSSEEKEKIYELLTHYKVPTTHRNLFLASRRYFDGTLTLDIEEYSKQVKKQLALKD